MLSVTFLTTVTFHGQSIFMAFLPFASMTKTGIDRFLLFSALIFMQDEHPLNQFEIDWEAKSYLIIYMKGNLISILNFLYKFREIGIS